MSRLNKLNIGISVFGTAVAKTKAEVILMNTKKSIQNKIKGFGIALSLVFSFMLLSGIETNAQWRQDRRDDVRDARQDGFREGVEEGRLIEKKRNF
jgi:hypothetical protein